MFNSSPFNSFADEVVEHPTKVNDNTADILTAKNLLYFIYISSSPYLIRDKVVLKYLIHLGIPHPLLV